MNFSQNLVSGISEHDCLLLQQNDCLDKEIIYDFECSCCLNIVVNPLECKECPKLACSQCIRNWYGINKSCPNCRSKKLYKKVSEIN